MLRVFIGGSISIKSLPVAVAARIDKIIEKELRVLVGDAPGVDRCVQQYLAAKRDQEVGVFYARNRSGDHCRNNLGHWRTWSVDGRGLSGAGFYAVKDVEMAEQADCGLMIWDGKSRAR